MKKNFALRLDAQVYAALERWAADEFRSVNGQIEWIVNTALKKAGRMPKNSPAPGDDATDGGHQPASG